MANDSPMQQLAGLEPTTLAQLFGGVINPSRFEKVIFYKKPQEWANPKHPGQPRGNLEAGWITWGDSQATIQLQKLAQGYLPLPQFGFVQDSDPHFDPTNPFAILLAHPAGASQFPADQVIAYRWYDPRNLPIPTDRLCPRCGRTHHIRFPQLAGIKIREFACPECTNRTFHNVLHLMRHMRNAHDYDRTEILALAQEMGVDLRHELRAEFGLVRDIDTSGLTAAGEAGSAAGAAEEAWIAPEIERESVPDRATVASRRSRSTAGAER